MRRKFINALFASAISLTMVICPSISLAALKAPAVEGFDFNYTAETDPRFPLVQVFDDGDRTYFQFAEMDKYPQVVMDQDGKRSVVPLEAKTPYLIVKGVGNKFILSLPPGKDSIIVSYNGKRVLAQSTPAVVEPEKTRPIQKVEGGAIKQSEKRKPTVNYSESQDDDIDTGAAEPTYVEGIKINVPFFENSVTVSKKAREDLQLKIGQLKSTHHAIVRGRPSATGDITTARTRAFAIKGLLLEAGMDETQIDVKFDDQAKTGKNEGFYLSEILLVEGGAIKNSKKMKSNNTAWATQLKEAPVTKTWKLNEGKTIGKEISAWATDAGWKVVWNLNKDWQVPSSTVFNGDFKSAAGDVIKTLAADGVLIRAQFFDGNKTMVVTGPGVTEQ